jgi:hypothetical protein
MSRVLSEAAVNPAHLQTTNLLEVKCVRLVLVKGREQFQCRHHFFTSPLRERLRAPMLGRVLVREERMVLIKSHLRGLIDTVFVI